MKKQKHKRTDQEKAERAAIRKDRRIKRKVWESNNIAFPLPAIEVLNDRGFKPRFIDTPRTEKQRATACAALDNIKEQDFNAYRGLVMSFGGTLGEPGNEVQLQSIPSLTNESDMFRKRLAAWSRKLYRRDEPDEPYQTLLARLTARDIETGLPLDPAGFAAVRIARKQVARFMRTRLGYRVMEQQMIALHLIAKQHRAKRSDSYSAPYIAPTSFAGAIVTSTMLEEMTLAALMVLRIRESELPMSIETRKACFDYFPNGRECGASPVIGACYRAARKALVKETESVLIGITPGCDINSMAKLTQYEPSEIEVLKDGAHRIRRKVYLLREYIARYWKGKKKERQGKVGDYKVLQMATRSALGLPVLYGRRKTLAARVGLFSDRIDEEFAKAIAKRKAAQRSRDYRARILYKIGVS